MYIYIFVIKNKLLIIEYVHWNEFHVKFVIEASNFNIIFNNYDNFSLSSFVFLNTS